MAVDNITVNLETPVSQEWVENPDAGGTPFLNAQGDGNYLTTGSSGDTHGDFSFDSLPQSPAGINSANLYIYCDPGSEYINIDVWDDDAATWVNTAAQVSGAGDSLHGPYDISAELDTPNNVANAMVRINSKNNGKWGGSQSADYLYITIDYEVGGQSYYATPDDFMTLSDNQYKSQSTLYDESATVSEFIAKSVTRLFSEITTIADFWNYSQYAAYYEDAFNALSLSEYSFHDMFQSVYTTLTTTIYDSKSLTFPLIESTSLSGYITQGLQWLLAESTTIVDDKAFGITTSVLDTLTTVSYLDTITQFYRSLQETITLQDFIATSISQLLDVIEAIDLGDYLNYISSWYRTLAEDVTVADSIVKAVQVLAEQAMDMEDFWAYTISAFYSEDLYDPIVIADYIIKAFYQYVPASLSLASYMSKYALSTVYESLAHTDYLDYVSTWERFPYEPISLLDYIIPGLSGQLTQGLTDTISLIHYLTYESSWYNAILESTSLFSERISTYFKDLTDTTGLLDYTYSTVGQVSTDALTLGEYITKSADIYTYQSLTLLDYVSTSTYGQLFEDVFQAIITTDYVTYKSTFARVLYDAVSLIDYIIPQLTGELTQALIDTISLTHYLTYSSMWYSVLQETTTLLDIHVIDYFKNLIDTAIISEYIYSATSIINTEAMDVIDYAFNSITQHILQSISLLDYVDTLLAQFLTEGITQGINIGDYITSQASLSRILSLAITLADTIITSVTAEGLIDLFDAIAFNDLISIFSGTRLSQLVIDSLHIWEGLGGIWDVYERSESLTITFYLTHLTQWYHGYIEAIDIEHYFTYAASYLRTIPELLSIPDIIDRQVNFVRVIHLDLPFDDIVITAQGMIRSLFQSLTIQDPYLRGIFLTLLQLVDTLSISDFLEQMIPFILKYVTVYLQDTTAMIYLKKTTGTLYTKGLTATMFIKRIAIAIYSKLRQR